MLGFIEQIPLTATAILLVVSLATQLCLALVFIASFRSAARERTNLHREIFGLVKKLEALTAQRREYMLKHYDKILENLANRLPPTIAAQAGQTIFETESKILTRLAELDPKFKEDEASRQKMDELIKSMEKLEDTIVALTADAVKKVMTDARRTLVDDDRFSDVSIAA